MQTNWRLHLNLVYPEINDDPPEFPDIATLFGGATPRLRHLSIIQFWMLRFLQPSLPDLKTIYTDFPMSMITRCNSLEGLEFESFIIPDRPLNIPTLRRLEWRSPPYRTMGNADQLLTKECWPNITDLTLRFYRRIDDILSILAVARNLRRASLVVTDMDGNEYATTVNLSLPHLIELSLGSELVKTEFLNCLNVSGLRRLIVRDTDRLTAHFDPTQLRPWLERCKPPLAKLSFRKSFKFNEHTFSIITNLPHLQLFESTSPSHEGDVEKLRKIMEAKGGQYVVSNAARDEEWD